MGSVTTSGGGAASGGVPTHFVVLVLLQTQINGVRDPPVKKGFVTPQLKRVRDPDLKESLWLFYPNFY